MSNATAPRARTWTVAPNGCWVWNHAISSGGYGVFTDRRRNFYAHRWMYELHVGAIPDGYHVDHLCRDRACVNPDHLEAVTPAENARRGRAARTHCKRGHELTEENWLRRPSGQTLCRQCAALRSSERRKLDARRGRNKVGGTRLWWAIMFRDGGVCQYCGGVADTVDHVVPRSGGGSESPLNIVAACRGCNIEKMTAVWSPRATPALPSVDELMCAHAARHAHRYCPDDDIRDALERIRSEVLG